MTFSSSIASQSHLVVYSIGFRDPKMEREASGTATDYHPRPVRLAF